VVRLQMVCTKASKEGHLFRLTLEKGAGSAPVLDSLRKSWLAYYRPVAKEAEALVAAGRSALEAGDWTTARESFLAALELEETAEALVGLGEAAWWLGQVHDSLGYRERAYAEFRRQSEPVQAAATALTLCVHYQANLGNAAASAGWLARATRLVEDFELQDLAGWIVLLEAGHAEDPLRGEELARDARQLAGRSGDLDLELCALAQIGASLVEQGKVDEGLVLLDEAMAGSLVGEGGNFGTVVFTSCSMIGSCTRCAEFERAVEWIRAADRFTKRYGCPFLYLYCRTLYGSVLLATGDWVQAEIELTTALRESRVSHPALHASASAALAELRLAQGRIEEAERLVTGLEDHDATGAVVTAIHLARGKPGLAATRAQRGLDAAGENQLEQAVLLELLGEAEIAQAAHGGAVDRGRELAQRGADLGCRTLVARGERLRGHALAGSDEPESRRHLDAALSEFVRLGMPFEAARTRLILAEALLGPRPDVAKEEARVALAAFEDLGASGAADRAASLLRRLGVKATRIGPKGIGTLTKRELEVLALLGEGLSNPEIAERLYLSRKTVEHHVARILSKLGVKGRAGAAVLAARQPGTRSAAE
jgi:DNA-binding CsgD family transcriptional regulator